MTEYPQHQKAVQRIKDIMRNAGAIIRENDNERGRGGYRFPPCFNGRDQVEYTADVFCILKDGRPIIFEVDGDKSGQGHFSERAVHRDQFRDAYFHNYGIVTVRYTPKQTEDLTEAYIMQDVEYYTRRFHKNIQVCAPKLTTVTPKTP